MVVIIELATSNRIIITSKAPFKLCAHMLTRTVSDYAFLSKNENFNFPGLQISSNGIGTCTEVPVPDC